MPRTLDIHWWLSEMRACESSYAVLRYHQQKDGHLPGNGIHGYSSLSGGYNDAWNAINTWMQTGELPRWAMTQ